VTSPGLSLQLYTLREAVADDLGGTLARIAEIGFRDVELWNFVDREREFAAALAESGLSAPSAHASLIVADDPAPAFAAAQRLGILTLIDPHYPAEHWTDRDDITRTAARLAELAHQAADFGLRLGYHNHAFELANHVDGVPALEVLVEQLDEAVVLEVDTYWAAVGGVDPVALLERLGDRVQLIHVKDGPGTAEPTDQVAVGDGAMDVAGILAAAPQARRVAELDDTRGDIWEAVARSFVYLAAEGAA